MVFLCELGLSLGKSLAELYHLSAAEISVWAAFRAQHGFPVERVAGTVAISGAYVGATRGGKAQPADLLPVYRARKAIDDVAGVMAFFDAHGVPVREVE